MAVLTRSASAPPNAASFSQTTLRCTSRDVEKLANPQSAPAITFSRPTTPAKRTMR
jgi:hypothetical protein